MTAEATTFNEHVNAAVGIAAAKRAGTSDGAVARDLSLAITHLEDALTRYNSSRYRERGTWRRDDPDTLN